MANTTFANLKIKALQKSGNNYNANDSTKLEMAGGLINDVLGMIGSMIKGHPFTLDIGNTISTTADQAYVDPTDTNIIEMLQIYQRVTNRVLKQITYQEYINLAPDPTRFGGVADLAWAPTQSVDVTGNVDWRIYLLPTPSSVITLYYDYLKDIRFSVDGTAANAEFCALPPTYDPWIYAEFKPLFIEIIDSANSARIAKAEAGAMNARKFFLEMIMSQATRTYQAGSARDVLDYRYNRVATTPVP